MRKLFLVAIALFTIGYVNAQDKILSMEDAVIGQWRQLRPESKVAMNWQGEKNCYTWSDYKSIKVADIDGDKVNTLVTLAEINKELKNSGIQELRALYNYQLMNEKMISFKSGDEYVMFSLDTKKIVNKIKISEGVENETFCKVNNSFAFTKDNNLYIVDKLSNITQVTNNADKNIIDGQSVSRSEFGIKGGIFWSPDGKKLAFYRKDVSNVTNFPLLDISTRTGDLKQIKYPMAGMKSEHVTLGIYDLATGNTVWVKPTDFSYEQYLTNISWGPYSKNVYIQVLNREQNHTKLNKYNTNTGEFRSTLLEEKDDRYTEPQHKLIFLKSNPSRFIYQTNNRHGFNHFYLVDIKGKVLKHLTPGNFDVEYIGFDKSERYLYYYSAEVSPAEKHLYRLDIKKGKKVRLTKDNGWHNVKISADRKYFIDEYSSHKVPNVINIANNKGEVLKNIVKAANPLTSYKSCSVELGKIKAEDGKTDLYYRMVKPADFDPNKKYPVVVYVYGGPHAQMVQDKWSSLRLWDMYMAQRGYVVFTLDNRGSENRGKEFEACIHRQCGQLEMHDQVSGVNFLKSFSWVDAERIGVHGWSYGGFMTISLITNYPDIFKVGVAGGPVIDWKWYEIMYGERYMDTPQENPEGYAMTSLINKAKDLKGKLLICQGAIDNTVVWEHSLSFIRECIKNNVQVDYFPYPRAEHNVRGYDRIHLKQKVSNYFDDYLK